MKPRDPTIDVFKGMLVFGMILSHVSGLISSSNAFPIEQIWLLTGLVTFSGFVFSFGYACQLAYFAKDLRSSYRRMMATAVKPLIAFYISGIYWRSFVDKQISLKGIARILLLRDIPPFSEFLVSFFLIILVSILLYTPIQAAIRNQKTFWITFSILLLTTLIPYHLVQTSKLGLLIGTDRFPTFPVLQYFPIFLLGAYFAKHKILLSHKTLFVSSAGLALFVASYASQNEPPSRFPPSLAWILGSLFVVYLYYLIAQSLVRWNLLALPLQLWGRNVLFYLLTSNILIFTFRGAYPRIDLPPIASVGLTLLVLFTIQFLSSLVSAQKPSPVLEPKSELVGQPSYVEVSSR